MKLICGMHRSGTSLVARLANVLGAPMGDEEGFHSPDRWNPDGYFEQRDILDVNTRLVNGPWGRAAYFHLPTDRTIRRRAAALETTIGDLVRKYADKVVKENRFCLTLGAWRDLGCEVERLLVVLRHPRSVARSLTRRNHIPDRLALSLWREHHLRLMRHSRDIPQTVLCYDALVQGHEDEMKKLSWFLGCSLIDVREQAREMIDPRPSGEAGILPDRIEATYRTLQLECRQIP